MGLLVSIIKARPLQVRRLHFALILILVSLFIGITGFIVIEDYTLSEAFYMTIITISTVGFGEVRELSFNGRIFVSFLIITNIGIFTYAISTIAAFIIEGQFRNAIKDLRLYQRIAKLEGHTIVCGYGRNGNEVCKELVEYRQPFVVIEMDDERVEELREENDYLFVAGDATHDDILEKAGIHNAKALVSALPKDADNVFVALTAKQMNPKLNVVCRASDSSSELKLKRAGADHIVMPEKIGGSHMAKLVTKPDIIEFFQVISTHGGVSIYFEELELSKLNEDLKDKTIRDLDIRSETGANIIGLKTADGTYHVNPSPSTILDPTHKLIVLGDEDQIEVFKRYIFTHQS